MAGPYEFGDVVDGYRWTVLGWEPVEGSERAASAALQHALGTHLERPAVTHHARHTSAAAVASAPAVTDPEPADAQAPPVEDPTVVTADPVADVVADEVPSTVPAKPAAAEPQRRWTPVGWEIVEPAEPVEEFADVVAAAPSAPPLEADVDLVDVSAERIDGEPVLDLREPAVEVAAREVTITEPPAGWYPG